MNQEYELADLKISAGTIARTVILAFALLNQVLTWLGKPIINIDSGQVTELVANVLTIVTAIISWWKNNSFTHAALAGDVLMHAVRKSMAEDEKKDEENAD